MTIASRTIETFLNYNPQALSVPLDDTGLSIQVVPTLHDLARAQKLQYAAFVAKVGLLVVWNDEPMHHVTRAANIEQRLANLEWTEVDIQGRSANFGDKGRSQITVKEVDPENGEIMPQHRPTHLINTVLVALTLTLVVTVLGAGYRELAIENCE